MSLDRYGVDAMALIGRGETLAPEHLRWHRREMEAALEQEDIVL